MFERRLKMKLKKELQIRLASKLVESSYDLSYTDLVTQPTLDYDPQRFAKFKDEYAQAYNQSNADVEQSNPFSSPELFQQSLELCIQEEALNGLIAEYELDFLNDDSPIQISPDKKAQLLQFIASASSEAA
jgi:hypothetical protein